MMNYLLMLAGAGLVGGSSVLFVFFYRLGPTIGAAGTASTLQRRQWLFMMSLFVCLIAMGLSLVVAKQTIF